MSSVRFGKNFSFEAGGGSTPFSAIGAGSFKPATTALSTVGKAAPAMGMLGKAGAFASTASNILGPIAMGLQVGNMLYGAWNATKQANKEKAALAKKAEKIQGQITQNSVALRDDLSDIDEDYQDKQTQFGEDIGEKLEDASSSIGQTIKRGNGLLTGAGTIQKQEIMDDTGRFVERGVERLNTQRGGDYAGIIDPYNRQQENSQQGLLDIASQRKQLESRDSFMENLLG
tara:strand:+ start:1438 stop:2127 length:690 start_codon:yes stop_codon:yes gene_type:complete